MSGKEREEMGRKLLDVLEERHSLSRVFKSCGPSGPDLWKKSFCAGTD